MIIVDSSIWISFFKNHPIGGAENLSQALERGDDIAIIPLILAEVLSGFKQDHDYKEALKVMSRVPVIPLNIESYVEATQMYRRLRKKGVTVRRIIDCIIAQACIETQSPLMTLDKDFKKISTHTELELI
jgi:predicted nucleic acid-binding protein